MTVLRALLALVAFVVVAHADGGAVVARDRVGAMLVTVFVAPVPLRVGRADVSVLVQHEEDGSPVLDADVRIRLRDGPSVQADHEQATNRLLYAAALPLPGAGPRELLVEVRRGTQQGWVGATLLVSEGLPPVARFWPWFLLPIGVVGVFLLHQWLRDRSAGHRPL